MRDRLLYYENWLVIPADYQIRTALLDQAHQEEVAHFAEEKMKDLLTCHYYWPQLAQDIHNSCRFCNICQKTKMLTQKKAGLLNPIPVPQKPFEKVTMDFMTDKTPRGFDIDMVIVDRQTKYGNSYQP